MMVEIKDTTRNGKTLFDFVAYCIQHPEERFWQALRNWSGYHFVEVTDDSVFAADRTYRDTFYLEGRRHNG